MDLDIYEEWADLEVIHVIDLLRAEGVNAVLMSCLALRQEGIWDIATARQKELKAFFSTSRGHRSGICDKMGSRQERHGFLIVAAYEARCAQALLRSLCKYGVAGSAGIPKSMLLGQASAAAVELLGNFPSLWPFDEHDPFEEELSNDDE